MSDPHACPTCGLVHEAQPGATVWQTRCDNCGALNRKGQVACRRCEGTELTTLDDEIAAFYPGLIKVEEGYSL